MLFIGLAPPLLLSYFLNLEPLPSPTNKSQEHQRSWEMNTVGDRRRC